LLGLEGIVSKLKDSRYRSGRSPDWIKQEPERSSREAGGRGGLGLVTPMREFADQKALQNYVKLHDLVYRACRPCSTATLAVGSSTPSSAADSCKTLGTEF
jgi:hypothetical protein